MFLVCVWKFDFCFKLVRCFNTMEGKLSPQVAVCLQENLYLPMDPWGEGIILFSLINFCLLLLSLHAAYFQHKAAASLGFLSPVSCTQVLVVLQSSRCGVCVPFWSPSQCQHVMKGLSGCPFRTHLFFCCPQGHTDAPCVSDLVVHPGWFLPRGGDAASDVTHSLWV